MTLPLKPGQRVELNDGRVATVRYVGEPDFAQGEWVGVEFEDTSGKNDGSVRGKRYFECEPLHGMFLKPSGIGRIVEEVKPAAKQNGRPLGQAPKGRLSSISGPATGLRSPTKSPTKQVMSSGPSSNSSSRTSTPSNANNTQKPAASGLTRPRLSVAGSSLGPRRNSLAPAPAPNPAARGPRQSLMGPPAAAARPTLAAASSSKQSSTGLSLGAQPEFPTRLNSISGASQSSEDRASPIRSPNGNRSPLSSASESNSRTISLAFPPPKTQNAGPSRTSSDQSLSQRSFRTSTQTNKEVEDLQMKLRIIEKKRLEDREKLRALEKLQEERNRFEMIIQKLQQKLQPQQQEISELRRLLKESEMRLLEIEAIQAEHDTVVEMTTLDREMAEETAETLRTELDALKQRSEELALENEILREENEELGKEMTPEERTSQGWLQMEKENERLREALLRLRDVTQEQEAEMKNHIKSLEIDVQELAGIKQQYDDTKARLLQSEADAEDLRQQLEAAMGAEDIIEELTEKNLALNEHIDELRTAVEDLQNLKELNDELEINHVEHEKQLQEVIDYKESVLGEQARRAAQQEEALANQDHTISRFRELVTTLQSDLEDMRASKQLTETEAQELSSRTRAMMDLNMKLQVSASKTQVKAIDLELRRLEAQEAAEHLAIVQLFLPEAFQSERDSILALLRFRRIAFKSNMLHGFIKEKVAGQGSIGHEDDLFFAFEVLDRLTWMSATCSRFISSISGCSVEQFAKYQGALYELEPVERALNSYIDGLKRDDFKEKRAAEELQRSTSLMTHLAEVHIEESLESYADTVLMRTMLMQSHMENTANAFIVTKSMVQSNLLASDEEEEDDLNAFATRADSAISEARSSKVIISKALRAMQELKARSLSLTKDTLSIFERCERATDELAQYSRQLGKDLYELLHEEGRSEPYRLEEVQSAMLLTTASVFSTAGSDSFATIASKLRALMDLLTELTAITSDLDHTIEFDRLPAPWVLRSKELQASKYVSVDAEEELKRLREEAFERATTLRLRDQALDEATVKIELLESRTRDVSKKADRIAELERILEDGRARETQLSDALDKRAQELAALEADRDRWRRTADERKGGEGTAADGATDDGPNTGSMSARQLMALETEIKCLQASVKYLREMHRRSRLLDNVMAQKSTDPASQPQRKYSSLTSPHAWLSVPLTPSKKVPESAPEPRRILAELTNVIAAPKPIALAPPSQAENRLSWRPAQCTPQWQLAREEERIEAWAESWDLDKLAGLSGDGKLHQNRYLVPWHGMRVGIAS